MSKYPGRIVTDLAPAGYSVFFDGSGDWLETPNNSTLALGSSDFSVEWWEYRTTLAAEDTAIQAAGTYGFYFNYYDTGFPRFFLSTSSGSWNVFNNAATGAISANTWNHFVVTRSGTAFRVFLNGVLSIYATGSGSVVQPNNNFLISGNAAQSYFPGYISNVRVVKGSIPTPYQTSSTTTNTTVFTPPTQVLNSTDTILLTCNSPAIIDQSNNAFAITVNGNSAVSTFTPFTAYVPYNPALGASTPGVWTVDEAMQAKGTRQWNMYDPRFNLTTLLLHGNGTNGAQNNTFLDSSSNNFTITRNGNTTQGTFSPFSQTGWSYFGSATTDKLTASSVDPGNFGSSAFTVEAWVYFNDIGTTRVVASNYQSSTVGWTIYRNTSNFVTFHGSGDGADITSTTAVVVGRWYHIAISGTPTSPGIRLFINGVQEGSTYTGAVSLNSTNAVVVGDGAGGAAGVGINGYISNLRLLKGTALYTTNFTPPTVPLTNITNTSLLTCQSNRFVDNGTANSGSGYTFTVGGTPSIQAFSPFYPTAAYTPPTIGGSGYFDGTGDYLSVAGSTVFSSTGDLTLEAWCYITSASAFGGIFSMRRSADADGLGINITNTGNFEFTIDPGGVVTTPVPLNQWNHVALVRSGSATNNCSAYLNGTRIGQFTAGEQANMASNVAVIGRYYADGTDQYWATGYISNVRYVVGQALYSGATITVPTAPLTTTSQGAIATNVELLTNFTNAGIVDSTAKNVLETLGNAQISTTQSRFGGSSMYFDGTGDALLISPATPPIATLGDFTAEAWVYTTSSGGQIIFYLNGNTTTYAGCRLGLSGNQIYLLVSTTGSSWAINSGNISSVPSNTWNHVAVVRLGGTFYLFLNGTSIFTSTAISATTALMSGSINYVGAFNNSGIGDSFNGYIDDARVTRFARYTGNFTPQTSQWQDE